MISTEWMSTPWITTIGMALVHFVWQGAAIGLLTVVLLFLMRSSSASSRYLVGLAGLLLMAATPLATGIWLWEPPTINLAVAPSAEMVPVTPDTGSMVAIELVTPVAMPPDEADVATQDVSLVPAPVDAQQPLDLLTLLRPFLPWIVGAWVIGIVGLSTRLGVGSLRVRAMCRRGATTAPTRWQEATNSLCGKLRVSRPVRVLQSTIAEVPTVVGWLRPVILLPASALTGLSPEQLRVLLAHEVAHIRRQDYIVNLLQTAIETVFFYHPAVWWLSNRIRQERENCCDDIAVAVCGDEKFYAQTLHALAELSAPPRQLAVAARGGQLLPRIQRLLGMRRQTELGVTGWVPGFVVLVALVTSAWTALRPTDADVSAAEPEAASTASDDIDQLTPTLIADRIEEAMQRFESIEYTAEVASTRNTGNQRDPQPVERSRRVHYRGDGFRWYAEEQDLPAASDSPADVAGFDGELHFYTERGRQVTYGEESGAGYRYRPAELIWHAGRGPKWLLHVLRREEARIDRRETVDGHPCVVVVTEFGGNENADTPAWRYEVTISPNQSYLPIRMSISYLGEPYAEENLSELTRLPGGEWYPGRLDLKEHTKEPAAKNKITRITSLTLQDDIAPARFRFEPPVGYTVMDRRLGYSWHEDPWWPELSGWFREQYDWPQPDEGALGGMNSFADAAKIAGQPAPPIVAAEWLNGDPVSWDRSDRKLTVLMFYGGQSIDPTPQWIVAIKRLHERYRELGLDVVGVASATSDPALIKATVKELAIPFPVAIDQRAKGAHGKTSADYAMRHYASVFLVDAEGLVHFVNADDRGDDDNFSRLEQMVRELLPGASDVTVESKAPRQLQSQAIVRAVRAELRRLREKADGQGRIHGTITGSSVQDVKIRVTPVVRLLSFPNIPTAWLNITADRQATTIEPADDGSFSIEGLPKGSYVVKFFGDGIKDDEHQVMLATHASEAELLVTLQKKAAETPDSQSQSQSSAPTTESDEGAADTLLAKENTLATTFTDTGGEQAAPQPKKDQLTLNYPGVVGMSDGRQQIIQPIMLNLVESSVYNSAQHPFAFSKQEVILRRYKQTLAGPHLLATLAEPRVIDTGDGKLPIAQILIGVKKAFVDATFTVDPDGGVAEHDRGRIQHLEHLRAALVFVAKAEDGQVPPINRSVRPRATFELALPIDGDLIPWSMRIARLPAADVNVLLSELSEGTTIKVDVVKMKHHDLTTKLSVAEVEGQLSKADLANLVRYVKHKFVVDEFTVRLRGDQDDIDWLEVVDASSTAINAGLDVGLEAGWVIELQGYHADQPLKPALLKELAALADKHTPATPTPPSDTEDKSSLAFAVAMINAAKAEMPVNKGVAPLKEQDVIKTLTELKQPEGLSDADFAKLKKILETRKLPRDVTLKQYVRYDVGTYVQHGWFVRLMLERDGTSPFNVWIRKHHIKGRPYTQKERQFREHVRTTGGIPTLGRLISYFDADPKFDKPKGFVGGSDWLIEKVEKAIRDDKDVDAFLELFHWEGVDDTTRAFVRREAEQIVNRQPLIITPAYKFYGGDLVHWQGLRTYEPNLEVAGYLDFDFGGGDSIWMEYGEDKDDDYRAKFISYVVKTDDLDKFLGRELTSPINVSGYTNLLPDGHLEMGWNITAPDELTQLRQANFELWRVPVKE